MQTDEQWESIKLRIAAVVKAMRARCAGTEKEPCCFEHQEKIAEMFEQCALTNNTELLERLEARAVGPDEEF